MVRNNLDSLLKVDSKKALLNCHSCDALVYYSLRVPSTEKGVCLYPFFFSFTCSPPDEATNFI